MKRLLSLLMAMSLVAMLCGPAYAKDVGVEEESLIEFLLMDKSEGTIDSEDALAMKQELDSMERMGMETSYITRVDIAESKNTYIAQFGSITDEIRVLSASDESVTIEIVEGERRDILKKTADGKVYLDGKEVIYRDVEEIDMLRVKNDDIELEAGGNEIRGIIYKSEKSLTPFLLPVSRYNNYLTSNTKNISLGKTIDEIAVATLQMLLASLVPFAGIINFAIDIGVPLLNHLRGEDPESRDIFVWYITYTAGYSDYQYCTHTFADKYQYTEPYIEYTYEHFLVM